jgi:hypothetical protein
MPERRIDENTDDSAKQATAVIPIVFASAGGT